MWTEQQFILTLQVSFLGIILVVGLFMIWRLIQRTETRVAALSDHFALAQEALQNRLTGLETKINNINVIPHNEDDGDADGDEEGEDEDEGEEGGFPGHIIGPDQLVAEMKALFGSNGFPAFTGGGQEDSGVRIVDVTEPATPAPVPVPVPAVAPAPTPAPHKHAEDETLSISSSKHFSKSKLLRMPVDGLREILGNRGLPTEGVKKELIDRILGKEEEDEDETN